MQVIKKHIAFLSLFVLLAPSIIQSIHALQDHTHIVCSAVNEQHFHEQEVNCSILHFHFEIFTFNHTIAFSAIPNHFYKSESNHSKQICDSISIEQKSSRAPPTHFII